jgi:hypothetical protein
MLVFDSGTDTNPWQFKKTRQRFNAAGFFIVRSRSLTNNGIQLLGGNSAAGTMAECRQRASQQAIPARARFVIFRPL